MRVYKAKIRFFVERNLTEEEIEMLPEDDESDTKVEEVVGSLYVASPHLGQAYVDVDDHLLKHLQSGEYEIIAIKETKVNIVNHPDDETECTCPICRVKDCPPEDIMDFKCIYCAADVQLADGDWLAVSCPECGKEIGHDQLIPLKNGKYMMVVAKKEEEENKDDDI